MRVLITRKIIYGSDDRTHVRYYQFNILYIFIFMQEELEE